MVAIIRLVRTVNARNASCVVFEVKPLRAHAQSFVCRCLGDGGVVVESRALLAREALLDVCVEAFAARRTLVVADGVFCVARFAMRASRVGVNFFAALCAHAQIHAVGAEIYRD
tara:strand:- start:917 stop:1258 length:342 start_codon:yes stop_codon:yes gene_type:complete